MTLKKKPATARARSLANERAKAAESAAFLSAEKWLEHLEEEIEPKCQKAEADELNLILENSPEDFETLESLKRVRAAVKASDAVALPESGLYYDALHAKIMAAVELEAAAEAAASKKSAPKFQRRFTKSIFSAIGMTMVIAIVAFNGLRDRATQKSSAQPSATAMTNQTTDQLNDQNFERKIAMVDSRSGASFARDMGSYESEEDFLTDTAASRLKQISKRQADAMIRKLKL